MSEKSLLTLMGETLDAYRANRRRQSPAEVNQPTTPPLPSRFAWLLPSPGNIVFTLLVIGSLLWAQSVGAINLAIPNAAAISTGTIAYQGRLANASGQPLTQTTNMIFRLYSAAAGGTPLWEEQWTGSSSVQVSDGLFNVMLGSLTPIPQAVITGNNNLFLGITVGTDSEMSPRVQLGSVPFAVQALTVPDGSITKAKLGNDVAIGLGGWERDESSTSQPSTLSQPDLLIQHGYAQHILTATDITTGYFDHNITFPTPYKDGTTPTIVFSSSGESATTADVPKGSSTNGAGENIGRIFTINRNGFQIRASGLNIGRRIGFYWIAIGQR